MNKRKSFKYYSIINVVFSFLTFYFSVSLTNDALNTILPALEQMNGWSRGQITSAVSIGAIISIFSIWLLGTLVLKGGVRKVLSTSLLLLGIVTIFMAQAGEAGVFSEFSLYIAIVQIFAASLFALPPVLLSNWFVEKRGRALGIATIGAPFGGATFNLAVGNVMGAQGFAFAYTGVGIAVIILAIIGFLVIVDKPEDVGLAPDGADLTEEQIQALKIEMESTKTDWPLKKMFTNKKTWLYVVSFGLLNLMITGVMSQLIPRLLDVGLTMPTALLALTFASLLGMVLSYAWGWLDDKFSTTTACFFLSLTFGLAGLSFLFGSADNMFVMILAIVCVASLIGGLPNLDASMIISIYGRKEFAHVTRYVRVGVSIFRSFGFVAMGVLFDHYGSYDLTYMIFIGMSIASALLILLIKPQDNRDLCLNPTT
ncbi:MFS transporter [Vibrio sp. RC27]